jgi:hypothetical protein
MKKRARKVPAKRGKAAKPGTQLARRPVGAALSPPVQPHHLPASTPSEILATRELFWHNVIREILTSLSSLAALRPGAGATEGDGNAPKESDGPQFDPALFDGRLAVMTKSGERVAIEDVFPLFACGINNPGERSLSVAVECTVFQIRTPGGQVYTLPLQEIRAFHALSPELMRKLERASRRKRRSGDADGEHPPFGFAAFTSLIQGPPKPLEPAPEHPIE